MLLEEVQAHIKQAGMESIADVKGETMHTDFVENMLTVHKKYRAVAVLPCTDSYIAQQTL